MSLKPKNGLHYQTTDQQDNVITRSLHGGHEPEMNFKMDINNIQTRPNGIGDHSMSLICYVIPTTPTQRSTLLHNPFLNSFFD